jgi:hypoxanthine-DNA glycosylase
MPVLQSFKPIVGSHPRVMILGSMPGVASLDAQQYYAHPRNAFWPIMAELFDVEWSGDYAQRVVQFQRLPLVLWDVLHNCQRKGSLDADIETHNLVPNDIVQMLQDYPAISLIAFNGATAQQLFRRHVLPRLAQARELELLRLPSTSPANARLDLAAKLDQWRVLLHYL